MLHHLLCHWPVGLETRAVGAAVGVILQLGAVLGLGGTSSSLQQGWAFASFAEVAGQGAHGVPGASCWAPASALVLASLGTEISHQHQRGRGLKKERRGFVYLNQK